MEKCQRCGDEGQDRRTLWLACFYDLAELDVPFERVLLGGKHYYTLRVCKDCRADWMRSIETWFKNIDLDGEDGVPGLYIRDNGTNRLMTQDELARRNSGQSKA